MSDLPPPAPLAPIAPFDPSDAWLLQSVLYAGGLTDGAELRDVIGLGDGIRDALFTADELRGGFARLIAAGYVRANTGRYFVVGEARGLAKREGLDLAGHALEITAFLDASNYRGLDSKKPDPELTDERIRQAVDAYLAPLREGGGGTALPTESPAGPEEIPEQDPPTIH
ncbi:MAG: hypothetical protein ABIV06_07150 [Thermoanaerobaculia bacterium]